MHPTNMYAQTTAGQDVLTKTGAGYYNFGKIILEIVALLLIVVPLLPLILITSLCLAIANKGKIVYTQERVGLNGKPFTIYKFRTLHNAVVLNMEKDTSIIKHNSHPFGILLRKTGLDEVLQVFNVIKGDMNLIGPRPLLMRDLQHLTPQQFKKRHSVNPGILGLWQLRRKYQHDKSYYRYDIHYIKNISIFMDVYILIATIFYLLRARGR